MDRYQCLELFYSNGGNPLPPPSQRASQGASDNPCDVPSDAKVSFFDNLLKKLDSGSSSQKKYLVFVPIPKIKFDTPPQGKNALVFIF